jgi:aspartate carbamoyltransferase catalytic subunit
MSRLVIPTLAPGMESRSAPNWFNDPIRHVIKSQQFSKYAVRELCEFAENFKGVKNDCLRGKKIVTFFEESSTRTRLSFESAMIDLGGHVLTVENAGNSSKFKGESYADTIRTVERYADAFVIRSTVAGTAEDLVNYASIPIINAGDGAGQHPTQALLDMYTIHEKFKIFNGLTIAVVGDLLYSRTVHSLVYMLSMFDVRMIFVAPRECKMKYDIVDYLVEHGVKFEECDNLETAAKIADVVYMTRIQKERYLDRPEDYHKAIGKYVLTKSVVDLMKHDSIVMHPLPRIDEIHLDVDSDHRAVYFDQVERGLEMRKALLYSIFLN